jgi:hypothetical protein
LNNEDIRNVKGKEAYTKETVLSAQEMRTLTKHVDVNEKKLGDGKL